PLEEVARYLSGALAGPSGGNVERPVTIIDAGLRKNLDLRVVSPVEQFGYQPERSIWPSIYRLLTDLIRRHRSTLVFANNRRSVERITAQLNEVVEREREAVESEKWKVESAETGADDVLPSSLSPFNFPLSTPLARAHHGSVSLEVRQETERAL